MWWLVTVRLPGRPGAATAGDDYYQDDTYDDDGGYGRRRGKQ
jgi:hypothetical protein